MKKESSFTPIGENKLKKILDFDPVEKLGQNFLVDPNMVRAIVGLTIPNAEVIEIGCGPGNITRGIAERANNVIGLEVYPGFFEAQEKILKGCDNVRIINQNALKFDFRRWVDADREARHQVMGNIPFHISEPLLTLLAGVSDKVERITLLVGDNLATAMTMKNPNDDRFTRLSFISSIFDVNRVVHIPRTAFWPVPRTDADAISMSLKEYPDDGKMFAFQLTKKIVLSQSENLTLVKVLNSFSASGESGKQLGKDMSHKYDRRQVRSELKRAVSDLNRMPVSRREMDGKLLTRMNSLVSRIGLPEEILSKPFGRLNNEEVRQLALAINRL